MTKKEIIELFNAHPLSEVVKHPNPKGLGRRKFLKVVGTDLLFERGPSHAPYTSLLSLSLAVKDMQPTDDGFTLLGGAIVYRWASPETEAVHP